MCLPKQPGRPMSVTALSYKRSVVFDGLPMTVFSKIKHMCGLKYSKACSDFFFEKALKIIQVAHKLLITTIQFVNLTRSHPLTTHQDISMGTFFIMNNYKAFEMMTKKDRTKYYCHLKPYQIVVYFCLCAFNQIVCFSLLYLSLRS